MFSRYYVGRQLQKSKEIGEGYVFATPKNGKSRQIKPAELAELVIQALHGVLFFGIGRDSFNGLFAPLIEASLSKKPSFCWTFSTN